MRCLEMRSCVVPRRAASVLTESAVPWPSARTIPQRNLVLMAAMSATGSGKRNAARGFAAAGTGEGTGRIGASGIKRVCHREKIAQYKNAKAYNAKKKAIYMNSTADNDRNTDTYMNSTAGNGRNIDTYMNSTAGNRRNTDTYMNATADNCRYKTYT